MNREMFEQFVSELVKGLQEPLANRELVDAKYLLAQKFDSRYEER